jgi:hypothetical protein
VAVWDELRTELLRICEESPEALTMWPMPLDHRDDGPPFSIHLAAWAAGVAEELHRRFGDDVELRVGAFAYPMPAAPSVAARPLPDEIGPSRAEITLDGALTICSGHTARHGLIIRNLTGRPLDIQTNGILTAFVVDPGTG